MAEPAPAPPALAAYLGLTRLLQPLAPAVLRRRLALGKEDPERWREKLGESQAVRPEGTLVWLHAVGLGEVLALRGLIERMADARPGLHFLVTSTARSSGEVFSRNPPPRTRHQYLPLDLPGPRSRFLDRWRPDLAVWAEQDLWPGLVFDCQRRGVPVALVNARMDAASFAARRRWRGVYAPVLAGMAHVSAQDPASAEHLRRLGARPDVRVAPTLKAAAPPLDCDAARLDALQAALAGRGPWLLASSHPEDEVVALETQRLRLADAPDSLLVIVPRQPPRGGEIAAAAEASGLRAGLQSQGGLPGKDTQVWVADSFGEMGLWLRLCPATLIGGSYGPTEGHNPWEAVRLGSAVLHGPRVANFRADFAALAKAEAAMECADAPAVAAALSGDFDARRERALAVAEAAARGAEDTALALLSLIGAQR